MNRSYNVVCSFIAALIALPTVVSAQSIGVDIDFSGGVRHPTSVPEIDASTGGMALAALGAALLLTWEINRRRKSV